ncbi:MAG TPA: CoF synthetase, partial [Candidatus Riflebacteria bacterium]|nr:CoF synthetase [Candidatus Riflebacteria bacterium]
MKKQKIYVFGQQQDQNWLNADTASELLEEAFEKAAVAVRPDLTCILEILDQVAQAWADPDYHLRRKAAEVLPKLTDFSEEMIEQGFKAISAICRRESLEKRLRGELGNLSVLDAGLERPHLDYQLRALPRGVLLHLTAGNVFVGAVDSLVSGIITKNANILKMSRVDPVFPVLFIESIKEHDPAGIIWPNQAAVLWKGGDESIETPLLNAQLTVIFWGGHDALLSVKARIGASTKLIENGPRYSLAVVEGQRLKKEVPEYLVKGLAQDLSLW